MNRKKNRSAAVLAAIAMAGITPLTFATAKSYVGLSAGNYNVAGNWSPSGIPANNDDVTFGNMNTHSLSGNVSATINTITNDLDSLTVNSSALPAFMIVNETAGGNIDVINNETIGTVTSDNAFFQSGGSSNDVGGTLILGMTSTSGNNTYGLSGANTTLSTIYGDVGVSGAGLLTQTGGSAEFVLLSLGLNSAGFGTYTSSGGAAIQAEQLQVGVAGGASFTLNGGSILYTDFISVGSTSSTATFNFGLGSIVGDDYPEPSVTISSGGTFNLQSGSSLLALTVLSSGGVLNVEGGAFANFSGLSMQGGTFSLLGNGATLSSDGGDDGSGFGGTSGTVNNGGGITATLTVDDLPIPISLTSAGPQGFDGLLTDGLGAPLALTVSGGEFELGTTSLYSANSYSGPTTVSGGGILFAGYNGVLSPNSNVICAGGTLEAGTFTNTVASLGGSSGAVDIQAGGLLITGANSSTFGAALTGAGTLQKSGTGTFTMSGGGSFTGNINIQAGVLAVGATNGIPTNAIVALTGIGANLSVGANQSLYSLSSGSLNTVSFTNFAALSVGTGNVPTSIGGNFSGAGTFIKVGTSNLTIGFGTNDPIANLDSTLTIEANAGTLGFDKQTGADAVAGPLTVGGGIALLLNNGQLDTASAVTVNSGALDLNGFNSTIGSLAGTAPGNVILAGGTLTVAQSASTTYGGGFTGPGLVTKTGAGTLALSGANGYNGSFVAGGGLLLLEGPVTTTGLTAGNGGTLELESTAVNLNDGAIQANAGGTVEYNNATVTNGFLLGPGLHVVLAGGTSTFSGVTTYNNTLINQNGPANLVDFTNGGTIANNAPLAYSGGVNSGSGIININSSVIAQNFSDQGVINIAPDGSLTNSNSDLYLEGGSRMYIGSVPSPGGTLTLQGTTTLEVNGALLVNEGIINGTTDVNFGGVAQGAGTYGPVNVTYGGLFQPGFTAMGASIPNQGAIISSLTGAGTVDDQSAGGSLNLVDNSSSVSTFSGVIQNSTGTLGLTLSGSGGLTLLTTTLPGGIQSTNSYSGGTTISGGTLTIAAAGALPKGGKVVNNGMFNVFANSTSGNISGGGTLNIAQNARLTITANTGTSSEGALTIANGSTLDLTNNPLLVTYGTGVDPVSMIASFLSTGFHSGWSSGGIVSSAVTALNAGQSALIYSVGYADGSDGITGVPSGEVEILPTLAGDAKMQGNVVFGDFQLLSQYFGQTGTSWDEGNFTYGSMTNFGDFQLLSQNFGANASALTAGQVASLDGFAAQFGETLEPNGNGFSLVSVPEPASASLFAVAGLGLLARRRSCRRKI